MPKTKVTQEDMLTEEPEVHCMGKMVDIKKVKPNPENPNVHPVEQIVMFAKILQVNGWREAIVVSKRSGLVVKGHGRLTTAKFMKLSEVPVEYQDYVDEQAELADMIADNRVAQHSFTDAFKLGGLLKKISDKGQETLGYSQEELSLYVAAEYIPSKSTDRKFLVLETLKMTKESKAIVGHAVTRYCFAIGKEVDWGDALAAICIAWESTMPAVPEPPPTPEKSSREKSVTTVKKRGKASIPDGQDSIKKFIVKAIAKTTIGDNDEEVTVIKGKTNEDRYYTNNVTFITMAKDVKESKEKINVTLQSKDGVFWITSMEKV